MKVDFRADNNRWPPSPKAISLQCSTSTVKGQFLSNDYCDCSISSLRFIFKYFFFCLFVVVCWLVCISSDVTLVIVKYFYIHVLLNFVPFFFAFPLAHARTFRAVDSISCFFVKE